MRECYSIPGVTDNRKVRADLEYGRDHRGESSIHHAHRHEIDGLNPVCTEACVVLEPGYKTRSVLSTTKEPIEEEA